MVESQLDTYSFLSLLGHQQVDHCVLDQMPYDVVAAFAEADDALRSLQFSSAEFHIHELLQFDTKSVEEHPVDMSLHQTKKMDD